jgi:hypothetical protein
MVKQPEDKLDSVAHHEERKALLQKEYELNRQKDQELAKQHATYRENQEIANYGGGIIKDGETREQLLERIRNASKPVAVEIPPLGRNPALQKELEAEQQAGREAVARAEAEEKRYAELRQKMEEAEGEKKGADDSGTSSKSRHG